MALLIAFNASTINADERAREHATMFAYGVTVGRVVRGGVVEALIIGALGTARRNRRRPRASCPGSSTTTCPRRCPTSAHSSPSRR